MPLFFSVMESFDTPLSSNACVLINGEKIRQIRQDLGFTQLYVATVLGVTTDTVSRWENKRSPSIKKENAEKLADILEVNISEICLSNHAQRDNISAEQDSNGEAEPTTLFPSFKSRSGLLLFLITLALAVSFFSARYLIEKIHSLSVKEITSFRILPAQIAPQQPFPVIISVETENNITGSFILRESFPVSLSVKKSVPPFQALNKEEGKWIAAGGGLKNHLFAYLAEVAGEVNEGEELHFSGHLLAGKEQLPIAGANNLKIKKYHWADSNADYIIDDNEILAIYSYFDLLQELGVDIDEIQRIWAGNGYRWDQAKQKFVPVR